MNETAPVNRRSYWTIRLLTACGCERFMAIPNASLPPSIKIAIYRPLSLGYAREDLEPTRIETLIREFDFYRYDPVEHTAEYRERVERSR